MNANDKPALPSDVEIADLIEGNLEGAERDRVLAAIQADPDSFLIYSEAAELLAEDVELKEVANDNPPTLPRWAAGLAAAAVLVIAVLFLPLGGPGATWIASSDLLEPAVSGLGAEVLSDLVSRTGLEDAPPAFAASSTERQRAIRLGAQSVDLALAREAGLTVLAGKVARDLLDGGGSQGLSGPSSGVLLNLSQGEDIEADALARLEQDLAEATDAEAFRAGQQLQALHVAAAAGASEALSGLGTDALEAVETLGGSSPDALGPLRSALENDSPDPTVIARLARALLLELVD